MIEGGELLCDTQAKRKYLLLFSPTAARDDKPTDQPEHCSDFCISPLSPRRRAVCYMPILSSIHHARGSTQTPWFGVTARADNNLMDAISAFSG